MERTLDTVARETWAARATSSIVAMCAPSLSKTRAAAETGPFLSIIAESAALGNRLWRDVPCRRAQ